MPIKSFSYYPSKDSSSLFSPADKHYIENPERKKSFDNTFKNFDVNAVFADNVGVVQSELLKPTVGLTNSKTRGFHDISFFQDHVAEKLSETAINIIHVGNEASDPMPITPWQQMHRLGHVFGCDNSMGKLPPHLKESYEKFLRAMAHATSIYIEKVAHTRSPGKWAYLGQTNHDSFTRELVWERTSVTNALFKSMGTFKSARNERIRIRNHGTVL